MTLWSFVSVSMAEQEIQENATVSSSPFYFDPLLTAEFIAIENLAPFDAMFVKEFGHFHIETTIFRDFHDALFAPPFDRVDSVACLGHAEGRLRDVIQFKLVPRRLLDLQKQVQASQLMR